MFLYETLGENLFSCLFQHPEVVCVPGLRPQLSSTIFKASNVSLGPSPMASGGLALVMTSLTFSSAPLCDYIGPT